MVSVAVPSSVEAPAVPELTRVKLTTEARPESTASVAAPTRRRGDLDALPVAGLLINGFIVPSFMSIVILGLIPSATGHEPTPSTA